MPWIFTDEMRFYLHEGETLLDGMMRTEHKDVRHMCRQGFCGACKIKVKAATDVPTFKQAPLAHLNEDEVLACCCVPTGTMVVGYEHSMQQAFIRDDKQKQSVQWHLQKTSIIGRQIFYKID